MRILLVSQSFYPHIGGVSTYQYCLARGLKSAGVEVIVYHMRAKGGARHECIQGIEVIRGPQVDASPAAWERYSTVKEHLYMLNHDLVDDRYQGDEEFLTNGVAQLHDRMEEEIADLICKQRIDVLHVNDYQVMPALNRISGQLPSLLSWHSPFPIRVEGHVRSVVRAMSKYRAVAFSNPLYVAHACQAGLPENRTILLTPFSDTKLFAQRPGDPKLLRQRYGIPFDAVVVTCVQRFDAKAGHDPFLAAAEPLLARYPKLWLLLVGGESFTDSVSPIRRTHREAVETRARTSSFKERIVMTGRVPFDDLADVYQTTDIFVMFSRRECFGLAILEAMASGLPVVGSDVDGIAYQIEHGKTGVLVPVGDLPAASNAIETLILDRALRRTLGDAARQSALSRFGIDIQIRRHIKVYQDLLEGLP